MGPLIENHPGFPNRVNVEFVAVQDRARIRQRTWERGTGETLACGSGCVAAAHALRLKHRAGDVVSFRVTSGDILTVELPEGDAGVAHLVGPARMVFEGQAELKEIRDV